MEINHNGMKSIENIFYAVLSLYIARKPINLKTIRTVLEIAGVPVNEKVLEALSTLVEAFETEKMEKKKQIDPRILAFLHSELERQKERTRYLEALLEEVRLPQISPEGKPTSILSGCIPRERESSQSWQEKSDEISVREVLKNVDTAFTDKREENTTNSIEEKECDQISEEKPKTTNSGLPGRYVYGIGGEGKTIRLGPIGIENSEVYTISYQNVCAIVHDCPDEPYQSNDDEVVKKWIHSHQAVLDNAKKYFTTIIPMGFDTILHSQDETTSPDQVVQDWLREDYLRLSSVMEKVSNKDEYGIQIFYEPRVVSRSIAEQSPDVKKIKEEMATKSPGLTYLYKQKLEKAVKNEMERISGEWFQDFYQQIKKYADDVVIEKTKKGGKDKVMLLNLSCLVAKENVNGLGEELETINNREGFSVRFTGPWPPYSFVAKPNLDSSVSEDHEVQSANRVTDSKNSITSQDKK